MRGGGWRERTDDGRHQSTQRLHGDDHVDGLAFAQHTHVDSLAGEAQVDDVLEREPLLSADGKGAVVGDGLAAEAEDDIVPLKDSRSGGCLLYTSPSPRDS